MNTTLQELLKGQEERYPHNLESRFARIFAKVMEMWGTPQLDEYLGELMIDEKGDRQGFPREVSGEIFMLSLLHDKVMAELNRKRDEEGDVWSNEQIKQGLEQEHIEYSPRGFFSALDANNTKAVQLFIEAGIDLDEVNKAGWTPLMVSSFMGSAQTAELLINAGANVNTRDKRGYGPLHWAAYRGFASIVDLLAAKGAYANAKSDKGLTPLIQASACGHADVVKSLIANKAIVNDADAEGWTPLHKAVANGHQEVVMLLLKAEADPNMENLAGLTPLEIARKGTRNFPTAYSGLVSILARGPSNS
jgi:uncharacterized protein